MATLEKIRSKKRLVFIILAIALFAFILGIGDIMSQCSRTPDTIAKANGAEVKYEEYRNKVSELQQQYQNMDNGVLEQEAINQLIMQKLLEKEYDALGIKVTDAEISAAMTGETPHPAVAQFITSIAQQANLPEANGRLVYDLMKNPTKYNLPAEAGKQIEEMWIAQEKNLEQAIKSQAYGQLLQGLFTANKIDAKAAHDNLNSRHVKLASLPLSTVEDADVKVEDADILEAYNQIKGQFAIDEETRAIEYIKVDIVPSQEDRLAAQHDVEDGLVGLREKPGVDAVNTNTRFVRDARNSGKFTRANIKGNNTLRNISDSILVEGGVQQLTFDGNTYTMVKVLGISSEIDSLNYSIIPAENKAAADSILTLIQGGRSFSSFADMLPANPQTGQPQKNDSIWTTLMGADETLANAFKTATVGQAFVLSDTIQGQPVNTVVKVNQRHNPVTYYDLVVFNYNVEPSTETINNLNADFRAFLAKNANAKAFAENASESGYNAVATLVSPSSPMIDNVSDTRNAIKWAMDADKGKVSHVFADGKQTYLLAVALDDVYTGDYEPSTSPRLQEQLKQRALNNKKAAKLIEKYNGKAKDIDGYAKAMGVEVAEADASFSSPFIPGVGINESLVQGEIAGAKKGSVVGPIQGNNAVIVFTVTEDNKEGRAFDYKIDAPSFIQQFNVFSNPMKLLLNGKKIKNNSIAIMQSVEEQ